MSTITTDREASATGGHGLCEPVAAAVKTMRLLSDPTRLRLLGELYDGEANVSTLCERLKLPQPTVSHHLGLLRTARIVSNRRSGKQVFYRLNEQNVASGRNGSDEGLSIAVGPVELHINGLSCNGKKT